MKQVKFISIVTILILINWTCSDSINELGIEPASLKDSEIKIIDSLKLSINLAEKIKDTVQTNSKCIYLTIDDGPLNGGKYIDSIATAKKVKTNLFVVGNSVDGSHKFKKYYEMFCNNTYIEIYNHSYTHANNKYSNYYKNPQTVLDDFKKNETELSISHKIARLPGRNLWIVGDKTKNTKQTGNTSAELLAQEGYDIYGWDVEWEYEPKDYAPKQSIDELIEQINSAYESDKTFVPKHIVLLMHDQMFTKINSENDLGVLIDKLKNNGYTFEYISSYPKPVKES